MFKFNSRCHIFSFLIGLSFTTLLPSLLSGMEMEAKEDTVEIGKGKEEESHISAFPAFSKLVFDKDTADPIEFYAHECLRIAQELLKETPTRPLEKIPSYASYNQQVENDFEQFKNRIFS